MTIFAPEYYKKFKCIADKCKNNCCIGWEIDIDQKTLDFYSKKQDVINHIEISPTAHFILDSNERCPFLNNDNLCEIIQNYGKNNLCQICSDHPRFRNFFISRTEIGIGMCCEEATNLILNNDFILTEMEKCGSSKHDLDEEKFFEYRKEILDKKPQEYISYLPDISLDRLFKFLTSFEKLSNDRDKILNILKDDTKRISEVKLFDEISFKRIFDYFVFRHLHTENLEFCVLCTYIIASLGKDIKENARIFSSEIEYSEENTDKLFELVSKKSRSYSK